MGPENKQGERAEKQLEVRVGEGLQQEALGTQEHGMT